MAGTGFQGLTTGLRQGSNVGAGVYGERLKAFQEGLSEREVFSDDSYINEALKQEKKTEDFMTAARMGEVSPSNSNMYESHYQLSRDMAEKLYSDEVLEHFAKSEEGMAQWSKMVDDLNRRVEIYEQVYEDSQGDINKADGTGTTLADQIVRSRQGGSQIFFDASGISIDKSDEDFMDTLKRYDQKQHRKVELNLETGEFDIDYTGGDEDVFDVRDPATASQMYSYNMMQSRFEVPADQAAKPPLKNAFDGGEEEFNSKFNSYYGKMDLPTTQFDRAAAAYYIDKNGENFTVQDVIKGRNTQATFDMEAARKEYREAVYDILDKQKKEEEKEKRRKQRVARSTASTSKSEPKVEMPLSYEDSFEYNNQQINGRVYDVSDKRIKIINVETEVDLKSIIRDENGDLYVRFESDGYLETLPLRGSNLNPNEVAAKIRQEYSAEVLYEMMHGEASGQIDTSIYSTQ